MLNDNVDILRAKFSEGGYTSWPESGGDDA